LHDNDLSDHNDDPDPNEKHVLAKASEHVQFIVDLPRADQVEDLEAHEQVEDESHVARGSCISEWLVNWHPIDTFHHSTNHVLTVPVSVFL